MFLVKLYFVLYIVCPYLTFHRLTYPPNVSSNFKINPIPPSSVCQCLDEIGTSFVIQKSFPFNITQFRYRSGIHGKKLQLLLLLLCGDIEINPGPYQLVFGHLNARSITSVTNEIDKPCLIQDLITDSDIEILSVNETWLNPNELPETLNSFLPENFSFINCPRLTGRGGGVGFIFRNYLKLQKCNLPIYSSFESLLAKCTFGNKLFQFLTIYRPPSSVTSSFLKEFSDLLESISSTSSELVISGDFNYHVDDINCRDSLNFLSVLENFDLKQHINFPTHNRGHTLDLFITRQNSTYSFKNEFEYVCFSDHLLVRTEIEIPSQPKIVSSFKTIRKLSNINLDNFKDDILSSALFSNSFPDIDSYVHQFQSSLVQILDKHAPLVSIKINRKKSQPFITKEIKAAKSKRSRLETIWRRTKSEYHKNAFKTQAKIVSKLITKSKQEYYRKIISQLHCKPKDLWSALNTLQNKNFMPKLPQYNTLKELTQTFSEFFKNKIENLCNKLPMPNEDAYCVPPVKPLVLSEFSCATPEEIFNIISTSSNSSCLLDAIPTKLLKSCADILVEPITNLINRALIEGSFPQQFKSASVRPLLKKYNLPENDYNSYRPISNLSFISKVLERVVFNRLSNHIQSFSMFPPFQSAYRKFHSTETALLRIQNDLLLAIDQKKYLLLYFLICLPHLILLITKY